MKNYLMFLALMFLSALLQIVAIQYSLETRGYFAIGGEWLIMPLALVVYFVVITSSEG